MWTVSPGRLRQELHSYQMVDIPAQAVWRISYLGSLLGKLVEAKHMVQDDKEKSLQALIDSLVR